MPLVPPLAKTVSPSGLSVQRLVEANLPGQEQAEAGREHGRQAHESVDTQHAAS